MLRSGRTAAREAVPLGGPGAVCEVEIWPRSDAPAPPAGARVTEAYGVLKPDGSFVVGGWRRSLASAQFGAKAAEGTPWTVLSGRGWRVVEVLIWRKPVPRPDPDVDSIFGELPKLKLARDHASSRAGERPTDDDFRRSVVTFGLALPDRGR